MFFFYFIAAWGALYLCDSYFPSRFYKKKIKRRSAILGLVIDNILLLIYLKNRSIYLTAHTVNHFFVKHWKKNLNKKDSQMFRISNHQQTVNCQRHAGNNGNWHRRCSLHCECHVAIYDLTTLFVFLDIRFSFHDRLRLY